MSETSLSSARMLLTLLIEIIGHEIEIAKAPLDILAIVNNISLELQGFECGPPVGDHNMVLYDKLMAEFNPLSEISIGEMNSVLSAIREPYLDLAIVMSRK